MNTFKPHPVEAPNSSRTLGISAGLLLCLLLGIGCVDIDGGAAELSWSLRTFAGEAKGLEACNDLGMERVRLCWGSLADGGTNSTCRTAFSRSFPCTEGSGVTGFEIAEGPTSIWLEPVCQNGLSPDPATYAVPPPLVRTVREGEVVTLNALLIEVTDPDECVGAQCTCGAP